jgi:hypothetical protein
MNGSMPHASSLFLQQAPSTSAGWACASGRGRAAVPAAGPLRQLGRGIPYFTNLTGAPHHFDDPVVIQGKRATHLRYRVRR